LYKLGFRIDNWDTANFNSTFQLYKQNTDDIFKLFNDLLISLPHVQSSQCQQWDVASFVAAMSALTLATYNTVQISKLEASIEAQKKKTDLLTDITKLHEQHLHKLDEMIQQIMRNFKSSKCNKNLNFKWTESLFKLILMRTNLRPWWPLSNASLSLLLTRNWCQAPSALMSSTLWSNTSRMSPQFCP
jgi:hypothetical protein